MRGYSSTRIMKITSRFTMMASVGILRTGEQIIAIKSPQSLTRYNGNRPIPLWRNMWLPCLPYPLCNLYKINMIQLIQGDCLQKMKDIPDNSVDSIVTDPPYGLGFMGKSTCTLYGVYDIMGLCKRFGIKLKRQILVGYGLAQTMVLGMVKFVLKERSFTLTDYLMSGLKVKYLKGIKLTIYVEFLRVVILNIWKRSLQRLMSIVVTQQSHTSLKLTV